MTTVQSSGEGGRSWGTPEVMVRDRKQSSNTGGGGYEVRNRLERLGGKLEAHGVEVKKNEATTEDRNRGGEERGITNEEREGQRPTAQPVGFPE